MSLDRPIRVAVVDDHPAIALAIRAAAQAASAFAPPIELVGAAGSIAEARQLMAGSPRPDVLLCDLQLRTGLDGLEAIDVAVEAGCKAIVLTSFDRASLMRAAFERGASGYLDKALEPEGILAAVRTVASGGTVFSSAALEAARSAPRMPSGRELEILAQLQRGATSDEIGGQLGISTRTVESHLRRLFDRYGVVSRTELAVFAMNQGWVDAGR
jgi:DNA-binding NarL/FixJ family response regulator